jgi:hypothetical protein
MATHEAPEHAKQQETEHDIAKTKMPDHGIATDIAGDDQTDQTQGQQPVKKTGG